MHENHNPAEIPGDLFAVDLDTVGVDELPTDAAFASLSTASSALSASCPASSVSTAGTVACRG